MNTFRQERIEKLLQELRYEIERGVLQEEIDEHLGFDFVVPVSKSIKNGVVTFSLRMRPMPGYLMPTPRLSVVGDKDK